MSDRIQGGDTLSALATSPARSDSLAVTPGNGMEASDPIAGVRTHGTQQVFIPV